MKQKDSHGFQLCPFSAQCLRLLDDLDSADLSQQFEENFFIHAIEDERLLRQLRLHVPDCPTCSALVRNSRCLRARQRSILYHLLLENESQVPSTAPQIFAEIHQEQNGIAPNSKRMYYYLEELVVSPGHQKYDGNAIHTHPLELPSSERSRRLLRNAFSLATVAAIIFAAIGLFGHMAVSGNSPVPHGETELSATNHPGWNSVVISLTILSASTATGKLTTIYNYDPATKNRKQLLPSFTADTVQLDGIPHEGQDLLYHYLSSGLMRYQTLQSAQHTGYLYQLNGTDGNAGNAIWTDKSHVFIANGGHGVMVVDTRTGKKTQQLPIPHTLYLAFYHSPYLYYVAGLPIEQRIWSALYRVNTAMSNDQPHMISMRSHDSTFWLSPDSTRIFYPNKGPDNKKGIYAVNIDGSNSHLLRAGDATPIGYAQNNAVMFMRVVNNKFQVVQLDNTSENKDKVVMANAAPGATSLCDPQVPSESTSICDKNIALAPYGHKLILNAYYPGGKHKIWYDDLTTNRSSILLPNLDSNTQVQLPGWDKMAVPATASSRVPVPANSQSPSTTSTAANVNLALMPVLYDRYCARQYAC